MKKISLFATLFIASLTFAQTTQDSTKVTSDKQINTAQRMLANTSGSPLTIGGYGEITYNQPEGDNGELDVQRLVLMLGYKFNEKTQFITEIEFEHVEEVFVEQAFINYNVADNISLRGGLMLVPMGIVNEYHEPTTFNGVERTSVDNKIVPTTWREIGVGVNGRIPNASLSYQAYIFNGFKSTEADGDEVNGLLKGSNGLRGGRQKGIQSTIDTPSFAAKLDYYGMPGLRLGLSGYFGKTQAEDGIDEIDGSSIGISMVGFDARYNFKRFTARGQFIYASLSDTEDYNNLTGKDLGSALMGYYVEGAYNLLPLTAKQKLFAFARYEAYDTHANTEGSLIENDAYNRTDITAGLSYHIAPGVVVKGDYQIKDNNVDGGEVANQLNFGVGVWF